MNLRIAPLLLLTLPALAVETVDTVERQIVLRNGTGSQINITIIVKEPALGECRAPDEPEPPTCVDADGDGCDDATQDTVCVPCQNEPVP